MALTTPCSASSNFAHFRFWSQKPTHFSQHLTTVCSPCPKDSTMPPSSPVGC
jgi:hypothetical protein